MMDATSGDTSSLVLTQPSQSLAREEAHRRIQEHFQGCTSYQVLDAEAALKSFQARAIPLPIITHILGYLLIFSQPLVLARDASTTQGHNNNNIDSLSVLRTCQLFYQIGMPLLYGMNIITATSPATSHDFDAHLATIPVKNRRLIMNIKLEIDWANELWKKFPLIAQQLGQLPLKQLVIILSYKDKRLQQQRSALADREANPQLSLSGKDVKKLKQNWMIADAKLKAEKKMLKTLVEDFRTLKVFRLEGFRDQAFADLLRGLVG